MTDLYTTIGILLGLVVGLLIGHKGRKERDERIAELEKEITVKQNVVESQNGTISRLRKKLKKKGNDADIVEDE